MSYLRRTARPFNERFGEFSNERRRLLEWLEAQPHQACLINGRGDVLAVRPDRGPASWSNPAVPKRVWLSVIALGYVEGCESV